MSIVHVRSLPGDVRSALVSRGWAETDEIDTSKAFDEFCDWHGLIRWGPTLRDVLARIEASEPSAGEIACKCGAKIGDLVDVERMPAGGPQLICPSNPPVVWAKCTKCGERTTVLASRRWELQAPEVGP